MSMQKNILVHQSHFHFFVDTMSLTQDLLDDIEDQRRNPRFNPHRNQVVYERAQDIVTLLEDSRELPTSIALDMYIAFREQFHGGWTIWLGNEEVGTMSPDLRARLANMSPDKKARHLFRLSLWNRAFRPRDPEYVDITEIPDGSEVYVARVTGLKLFENHQSNTRQAQGNTSRIEPITNIEDTDSEREMASATNGGPGDLLTSLQPAQDVNSVASPQPSHMVSDVQASDDVFAAGSDNSVNDDVVVKSDPESTTSQSTDGMSSEADSISDEASQPTPSKDTGTLLTKKFHAEVITQV